MIKEKGKAFSLNNISAAGLQLWGQRWLIRSTTEISLVTMREVLVVGSIGLFQCFSILTAYWNSLGGLKNVGV